MNHEKVNLHIQLPNPRNYNCELQFIIPCLVWQVWIHNCTIRKNMGQVSLIASQVFLLVICVHKLSQNLSGRKHVTFKKELNIFRTLKGYRRKYRAQNKNDDNKSMVFYDIAVNGFYRPVIVVYRRVYLSSLSYSGTQCGFPSTLPHYKPISPTQWPKNFTTFTTIQEKTIT